MILSMMKDISRIHKDRYKLWIVFNIMGNLTFTGELNIDTELTPIDIIRDNNIKVLLNRKIIGVQIGGVFGNIVFGSQMNTKIKYLFDKLSKNYIFYIDELFCPVDYVRFLSRFLIREMKIKTDNVYSFNEWIEAIAQGKSSISQFNEYENILNNLGDIIVLSKTKAIVLSIIDRFKDVFIEHIEEKKCSVGICRTLIVAQCINACPAEIHIPGYVALMKKDDYKNGYALMRKSNPLSLICGKICARPCEDRCRRKEIEENVGVRALQRYVCINALKAKNFDEDKAQNNGKKISIIGSGPAGLTAAYFLQRTGYQVDIYEKHANPGGVLSNYIPSYRLEAKDIMDEVDLITRLGVKMHYNSEVGKDIKFDEIRKNSDALIIAVGTNMSRTLDNISSNKNVMTALDFLSNVKQGNKVNIGKNVIVMGGGDVAMDSARTAMRLGNVEDVTVVSLEEYDQMPASLEEKRLANLENIIFLSGYGLDNLDNTKGSESMTVKFLKCLSVFDLDGKFSPTLSKDETETIEADTLILAIGQYADLSFIDNQNIKEFIKKHDNVYAIGDVVRASTAIAAIGDAKKIAIKIDKTLGGNGLYLGDEIDIPDEPLSIKSWDYPLKDEDVRKIENIKGDFDEVVATYTREDALYEATRCMRCDRNSTQPLFLRK